ncbi:MAG: methyltransferase domain-containing protein [Blastocatellia bacterium]
MPDAKELAYRYDLFITPDWRERFDTLVDEKVAIPIQGRILEVNSGTGARAIELVERMHGKGEAVGIDPSAERITLARAKAQIAKTEAVIFEQGISSSLPFESNEFDAVIGDASMLRANQIDGTLAEMLRVAKPEAPVILKLATHGSFGEFFSIYWEALYEVGMADEGWSALERLISERLTLFDAELMAERLGLRKAQSFLSKEEFVFETGAEFLESPLIQDAFLDEWLDIVPARSRDEVRGQIVSIIDRERRDAPFYVSVKASVITGVK